MYEIIDSQIAQKNRASISAYERSRGWSTVGAKFASERRSLEEHRKRLEKGNELKNKIERTLNYRRLKQSMIRFQKKIDFLHHEKNVSDEDFRQFRYMLREVRLDTIRLTQELK